MKVVAIASALAVAAATASSASAEINVRVDQVRRLSFPGAAADVVVGNPDVADVTVVDGRNVFITGRAAGATDVIVLDAAGRTILSDSVRVGRPGETGDGPQVSIARGTGVTTVSCSPRCADAPSSSAGASSTSSRAQIQAPSAGPAASVADVANQTAPAGAASSGSVG